MSAEEHKKRGRGLFKTNIFGIFIGIAVFLLIVLISQTTSIFDRLEVDILDLHYKMKGRANREIIQGGVTRDDLNLKISPDILIVGIDSSTLDAFGRWPFQRSYHASFLDSLTRISNENEREASVFMDIFFINPDSNSYNDVKLINSIEDNGRVFLETVLSIDPPSISMPDVFQRQEALYERYGSLTRIEGDYSNVESFHSAEPPLIPYAQKARGYGHANFREDSDKIYRRQQLIARLSEEVEKYRFEDLYIGFDVDRSQFQHLSWQDKRGLWHDVDLPLNEQRLKELQHELESEAPRNPLDLDGNGENDDDQDGEFDN
ncbi:MAG: CHASE2 domain-containing protein [Spirochaetaceae bacterium]|nr:CHASE2 domain-containing protein [Spirochaetaceae bacterium]